MKRFFKSEVVIAGLAIFSMFFGAGNVVFPLILGCVAGSKTFMALAGFLITAVGLPILGVISIILFNGDYKAFFYRLGKTPGFVIIAAIMALIGPFAAIPRCITLSHSAFKMYVPSITLLYFSFFAAAVLFAFTIKKSKMLDVLGAILTPILLLSLGIIIVKGLLASPGAQIIHLPSTSLFLYGLIEGYNTMDLLGALFFSGVVLTSLRQSSSLQEQSSAQIALKGLHAGLFGSTLLGIVYVGLSFVAALQGATLSSVAPDELLTVIAYNLLGKTLGIVSSIAVALACLTTAIALANVFADFLHQELLPRFLSYAQALCITLLITIVVSNLGFSGIMKFLVPILVIGYPAIIMLTIMNIAYKLWNVQTIRVPVALTLVISLICFLR